MRVRADRTDFEAGIGGVRAKLSRSRELERPGDYVQKHPGRIEPPRGRAGAGAGRVPLRTACGVLMVVESSAGGTGRHVLDLSEGLIRRGCEVHLSYATGPGRPAVPGPPGAGSTGLRHAAVPMRTSIHPSDLGAVRAVRRYSRARGGFDVIHGHSSKGGAIARLAAAGHAARPPSTPSTGWS